MPNQGDTLKQFVPTGADVDRYIAAAGENSFVDAKGPCSWDDDCTKAALAKDFAAFANSEGGGAIVVGKSEAADGKFRCDGVTPEQCKSFDTTKVAQWVNNHFSPSIRLTCCPVDFEGKTYVVIVIAEFSDKPAICVRDSGRKADGRFEIVKGTLYVRTDNAASVPLHTPEHVSRLIGRAVVKQQQVLREMFDSVLAGRAAMTLPTDEERFNTLAKTLEDDIFEDSGETLGRGGWKLLVHPDSFDRRWNSDELFEVLNRCLIRSHRFPQEFPKATPREWGISGGVNGVWGVTHEGLLYFWRGYWENNQARKTPYVNDEDNGAKPGEWLEMRTSVEMISDLLAFAARFAAEFSSTTPIRYLVEASNIKGRHLLHEYGGVSLKDYGFDPCAARNFRFTDTSSAGRIENGWRELATDCMYEFATIFPGGREYASKESLRKWIERYSNAAA